MNLLIEERRDVSRGAFCLRRRNVCSQAVTVSFVRPTCFGSMSDEHAEWRERNEDSRWHGLWAWANTIGSLGAALIWGVAFSNLLYGVPILAILLSWLAYVIWRIRRDPASLAEWGFSRRNLRPAFLATAGLTVGMTGSVRVTSGVVLIRPPPPVPPPNPAPRPPLPPPCPLPSPPACACGRETCGVVPGRSATGDGVGVVTLGLPGPVPAPILSVG